MKKKILIIDDEKIICMSLKEGLTDLGYSVDTALNAAGGLNKVIGFKPHVIFLDMRLSEESGLELIKKIKEIDKDNEVVIMTAYGDVETAVTAIKNGAFDYIKKPFDLEEIDITISKAFENLYMKKKLYLLEKEKEINNKSIIGNHPSMNEILKKIDILAANDKVTVLIRGETGTGKELVAEAIHKGSIRRDAPMLKINCGAIPQQLVESELFGFEKHAFTGAKSRKKGLFEIADGGTIFLDEIGEISIDVQTKLLRFLEERKFKRVGGLKDIEVDVRIITATNKDLEEAVKTKEFRQDLYYRLNVVPINLPPLRNRGTDILLLADYYLDSYNKKFNKNIEGFTEEAKNKLLAYSWPGNIRELKNIIERIVILHKEKYIDFYHIPIEINSKNENKKINVADKDHIEKKIVAGNFSLEDELESIERKYIKIALEKTNNNYTQASKLLGISRFALKRRIEKYFEKQ